MSPNPLSEGLKQARGRGKRAVAKLARRVLPGRLVTLAHVEPGVTLTVNLKRHVMFWSGGLARFEPYAVRALRAAVEPGDVVFDVGANVGFFSTLFSRWVGSDGAVLAFEPEPENAALLKTNLGANRCGNVEVVEAAVGAVSGVSAFSVDAATGSTGHLGAEPTAGEEAVGSGALRVIETRVVALDDLVFAASPAPAVVKLDIEGYEILALEGAHRTLSEHRPVVVTELAGDEGWKVVDFLDALDYRLWDLETGRPVAPGGHPFMAVALPRESADGARAGRILGALNE